MVTCMALAFNCNPGSSSLIFLFKEKEGEAKLSVSPLHRSAHRWA